MATGEKKPAPAGTGAGGDGLAVGGNHDQKQYSTPATEKQAPSLAGLDMSDLAAQSIVTLPAGNGSGPDSPPAILEAPTDRPEHFTDLGNAYRLVRLHGADLRHVTGWGWLSWDGQRWQRDEKTPMLRAKDIALSFYRDAEEWHDLARAHLEAAKRAAAAGDTSAQNIANERHKELTGRALSLASWAKASQARGKLEAAVKLAESERAVSAEADQFDADPWLLNCANGVLDLRTGTLRPHDRDDLLTALAPVAYDPDAKCPTWDAFLTRIMGGSSDLIGFLQRIVGYALTGSVREQAIFFLYGSGANGKSTFLKTILAMLGRDYAKQAAPDVLIESRDRHPTELADLAGVRFVASIEVSEGKRLAEALVKQLTGGDPVKARLMRQDFFQFDPQFKIFLAANHKPVIRGTDFAIWRRIKLIPFTVTIPEDDQDKALGDKLLAELPGVLAWAVRGCLDWQAGGLREPAAVSAATAAYRAESDLLGAFLAECCEEDDPKAEVQAGPLYKAYVDWAEKNGEKPVTGTMFGRRMTERGIDKYKDRKHRVNYIGIRLAPAQPTP
jgi:putative DNA primase/helicase